jgi:glycosyltransferase involved in cell wall biosynthesis
VIAGTFFESIDDYRRQVVELGLEGDVRFFPGYVPDSEVVPLISVVDLVVLPYRSGSQTGIGPLAATLGRPVVATDAGGISESAATRVVRAGDRLGLAAAIVECLRVAPPPRAAAGSWDDWSDAIRALVLEKDA